MSSHIQQIEQLMGLAASIDSGKYDTLIDALATRVSAQGAKDIAEAVETLGPENASLYIPISRSAYRAKQELVDIEHRQRMNDLEYRDRKAQVEANEASARLLVAQQEKLEDE